MYPLLLHHHDEICATNVSVVQMVRGELGFGVVDAQHLADWSEVSSRLQPLRWGQSASRGRLRPAPMMDEFFVLFFFPPSPGECRSEPNMEKPHAFLRYPLMFELP